ncbi:MAG: hypothetical protein WBL25_08790 [Anaerolineales bacterium]
MKHPLANISSTSQKPLFFAFLTATLILFAVFQVLDAPLRTPTAPNGILSFELAGTPEKAFQILVSWEAVNNDSPIANELRRKLYAAFGLGLDYLFMPVYATTLALGILLATGRHKIWFGTLGAWLGWGAYAAALFDTVENYALVQILLMNQLRSPYPQVASVCAIVKFGLLILGLVFALVGWLWPKKVFDDINP